jgi:quercetin dioxygenase-like cupin family protein
MQGEELIEKVPHIAGQTYLGEYRIPAGIFLEKHKHCFDHLSYLASGNAVLEIDGESQEIEAPSCVTVEAGKLHKVTAITDTVWLCIHSLGDEKVGPKKPGIELLWRNAVNVNEMAWALREKAHLWDSFKARTEKEDSPHYELSDIFVRWCPEGKNGGVPHDSVWCSAADELPIKPLVMWLMAELGGVKLGGVFVTKIPPGKTCKPHIDDAWHAREYEKFAVQIESAPGQVFHVGDDSLETRPGDVFTFDNQVTHWVDNPTKHDRITLIAAIKR